MGHVLARQQQFDLFDALTKTRHRFVRRAAEAAKFVRQEGAREADIEPSVADRVEHADFAGELQRVVEDRQYGPGYQTCAAGALGGSSEEQHRVGAVAAIVMKIMFDDANMRKPEFLGLLR